MLRSPDFIMHTTGNRSAFQEKVLSTTATNYGGLGDHLKLIETQNTSRGVEAIQEGGKIIRMEND